jgi:hypothetical protein
VTVRPCKSPYCDHTIDTTGKIGRPPVLCDSCRAGDVPGPPLSLTGGEWTGEECYAQLQPHIGQALSTFVVWAQRIAQEMALSGERGGQLHRLLRNRVIEGSAEHGFAYWKKPPRPSVLFDEAEEELLDAIVYFALWHKTRGLGS